MPQFSNLELNPTSIVFFIDLFITVTNKNKIINIFNTHRQWVGFMISDEIGGFLLFDTKCNWEFYAQ
jgi:hypothetical protein